MHNFFLYVYFYSLHVSGSHVPIIRRINFINATSGVSLCVDGRLVYRSEIYRSDYRPAYQTAIYTEGHTRCRIDKINSPDDGHMAARNM